MNTQCNYRIKEKVYIGRGIRMSKDKSTVTFDNKPMKDIKIETYSEQGFKLSHISLDLINEIRKLKKWAD